MAKINTTCKTCGVQYYHCYACPADLYHPSWKALFHEENCQEIFTILGRHGQGLISAEEAKELLAQCDLSQKNTFNESIKNHIALICGEDVAVKEEIVNEENTTSCKESVVSAENASATLMPFKAKKKHGKNK